MTTVRRHAVNYGGCRLVQGRHAVAPSSIGLAPTIINALSSTIHHLADESQRTMFVPSLSLAVSGPRSLSPSPIIWWRILILSTPRGNIVVAERDRLRES